MFDLWHSYGEFVENFITENTGYGVTNVYDITPGFEPLTYHAQERHLALWATRGGLYTELSYFIQGGGLKLDRQ